MTLKWKEIWYSEMKWDDDWERESWKKDMSDSRKGKDNIADLLPKDPFNMNLSGTAIDKVDVKKVNQLFDELNYLWYHSMRHNFVFFDDSGEKFNGLPDSHLLMDGGVEEITSFTIKKNRVLSEQANKLESCTGDCHNGDGGSPPDALFFALGYLKAADLLSVERVCKSLRDAVQNDPLLWRNICIDCPLSNKITDDALLRLTKRAQGRLESFSLLKCLNITDTGLKRVLESNRCITKLSVEGCGEMSIDGLLCSLRSFKPIGTPRIKRLRIGGISGITYENFEELKLLLSAENPPTQSSALQPRYYRRSQLYLSLNDERIIDFETCPRCQYLGHVYDCPSETCPRKYGTSQLCRACTLCIARCINCGGCLPNNGYEQTYFPDVLCRDCKKLFLDFRKTVDRSPIPPSRAFSSRLGNYHFYLFR